MIGATSQWSYLWISLAMLGWLLGAIALGKHDERKRLEREAEAERARVWAELRQTDAYRLFEERLRRVALSIGVAMAPAMREMAESMLKVQEACASASERLKAFAAAFPRPTRRERIRAFFFRQW